MSLHLFQNPHDAEPVAAVATGPAVVENAIDEVGRFDIQRRTAVDVGNVDIAVPNRDRVQRRVGGGKIRALVENADLLRGVHVVEDHHLFRAHNHHLPRLVWVEPGNVNLGDAAVGEMQVGENHVLDAVLQEAGAAGGNLVGLGSEQIQNYRNVVWGQRPEGVLALADDAQVQALRIHVMNVAQAATVDMLFHGRNRRVIFQQMADHQLAVHALGQLDHLLRMIDGQGRRLFHKHMLAGRQRTNNHLVVQRRGSNNRHGIRVGIVQHRLEIIRGPGRRIQRRVAG